MTELIIYYSIAWVLSLFSYQRLPYY